MCEQLASGSASKGWDVVLLTAASKPNARRERRDGYTVLRRGGQFTVYFWALAWLLSHRHTVRAVIDSENGIPFFTPLALPRRTPIVLLFHHVHLDQFSEYFPGPIAWVARHLEGSVLRRVYGDRVIACVSPSTRRDVRVRLRLKGRVVVIPNGAPAPKPLLSSGERSNSPRIVCVGRLVPHKRPLAVLEAIVPALEEFPDLELHFVGDGPERGPVSEAVRRLGLERHVRLHGAVPAQERDEIVRTSWLTVSASLREGWGLSILEANSWGVPAAAVRSVGLKDSIRHGETGWLAETEDQLGQVVHTALRQLREPEFAVAIAARCRSWVRSFPWSTMINRFMATLEQEELRLSFGERDRRALSDLSAVVHLPIASLKTGALPGPVRATDEVVCMDDQIIMLLHGADTECADQVLSRLGLNRAPPGPGEAGTEVRVARPTDLLVVRNLASWSSAAVALGGDETGSRAAMLYAEEA